MSIQEHKQETIVNKFVLDGPIKILTCWSNNLKSNTDCTICRNDLNIPSLYAKNESDDPVLCEGICTHTFHKECIEPWLKTNKHCPICSSQWFFKDKNKDMK